MISDANILKHIARQPKRAAGYKQLVRELGLHGEARGELESRVQKLVEAHQLVQLNSDRYALPQPATDKNDKNLVAARLTMHRHGVRFVIPDAGSLRPNVQAKLQGEIFFPRHPV